MAYRPPILNAQRIMQARLHRQRLLEALASRIAQLEEMQASPAVGELRPPGFVRPNAAAAAQSAPLGFQRPSAVTPQAMAAVGPAGPSPAPQVPPSLLHRLPMDDAEFPDGWEETLRRILPQLFRRDPGVENYVPPPGRFVAS